MIELVVLSVMLFFISFMMLMLGMYFLWYIYELILEGNIFSLNSLKM